MCRQNDRHTNKLYFKKRFCRIIFFEYKFKFMYDNDPEHIDKVRKN